MVPVNGKIWEDGSQDAIQTPVTFSPTASFFPLWLGQESKAGKRKRSQSEAMAQSACHRVQSMS